MQHEKKTQVVETVCSMIQLYFEIIVVWTNWFKRHASVKNKVVVVIIKDSTQNTCLSFSQMKSKPPIIIPANDQHPMHEQ